MNHSEYPFVDTHTHILPGMDDGAADPATGVEMVKTLLKQNIQRVFATSHYYHHKETVSQYLDRRAKAYIAFMEEWHARGLTERPVLLGAEVSIERELAYATELDRLCIEGTDIILLEMPFQKLKGWEVSTVENIAYKYRIRPMIAHLDRYLDIYDTYDMQKLFEIPDIIFQFNTSCLEERRGRSFCLKMIKQGIPAVFGSDCHNMDRRKPEYLKGMTILRKKLDKSTFDGLIYNMHRLLDFNQ